MTNPSLSASTRGALFGLGAAALFGLSAPLAKVLLGELPPVLLAGLLYLGAALGLSAYRLIRPASGEARLQRSDFGKLALVVGAGGVLGPVLMLLGLSRVSAVTGSLLLNLEAPFTVLLALLLFGEHLGRNGVVAALLICVGASVLKFEPSSSSSAGAESDTLGVVWLAAACACWALDNNLTQKLSLRDPLSVVRIKAVTAGAVNTALGLTLARHLPPLRYVLGALVLGSLSYGVSVLLDAYALRSIGAAREAAYFATAPFVGALGAAVFLGERWSVYDGVAMLAMAAGVALLLRERHSHLHEHEALEHEHLHEHDAHHQHAHAPGDPSGEPHSHLHRHVPLVHDHAHLPDVHHRHRH